MALFYCNKGERQMQFVIRNRQIKQVTVSTSDVSTPEHLIGDNSDYIAKFAFDSEWSGVTKTARFEMNNRYVDIVLENDECDIPVEVLTKGYLSVGVYSSHMTTTSCEVYITPSIKEIGGNVADPTPDVYNQILDAIDNIVIDEEAVANAVEEYLDDHPVTVTETDPTVPQYVKNITQADITAWNNKSDFSGSYNDLTDQPTIPVVPTNVSAFTNDAGYLTEHQSLSNYYTKSETYSKSEVDALIVTPPSVPTKTSDLINDSGFITINDVPSIPSKTSDLTNDSGFITSSSLPTKTSDLTNDSGFITSSDIPTNVSSFTNDAGYLTQHQSLSNYYTKSEVDALIPTVPTNVSAFTNDAGYLTSSALTPYSTTTQVQTMIDTAIGGAINASY